MVYLRNVHINTVLELSEFPSIDVYFYSIVNDTLIDKHIGKNFEAPKNNVSIYLP